VGFEISTRGLKVHCSASELPAHCNQAPNHSGHGPTELVLPPGFEPGSLSNLETVPGISRVFYR
jgi:hypothetical protein